MSKHINSSMMSIRLLLGTRQVAKRGRISERSWHRKAFFITENRGDHIWIQRIRTIERGQGYGSACLKWICSLADRYGVTLRLEAIAFITNQCNRLEDSELIAWYKRHGFRITRGTHMIRRPKHGMGQ